MIRTFVTLLIATVLLAGLGIPLVAVQPGVFVLGGQYNLTPGETLQEDMNFYFAQVTIDDGASVEGHIYLFSSTLDLGGVVTEDVHAFESDLTLRETAQVHGEIDERDFIHWTLLLPAIALVP